VALLLRKNGITRIRPLLGGLDAWRERGYPMDTTTLAADTK
jgi:rhodanese-related sulfurtransferase